MDSNLKAIVSEQLIRHEGLRLKPYRCTAGKLTIGVGRNLDDKGISEQEAMDMLDADIEEFEEDLLMNLHDLYMGLNDSRKAVLLNMCFNMGIRGLLSFKNTLKYIERGEYAKAADNMLLSKWAKQVGSRAKELSDIMLHG